MPDITSPASASPVPQASKPPSYSKTGVKPEPVAVLTFDTFQQRTEGTEEV